LISSGVAEGPSEFIDASESGDDVFFVTPGQLVPEDTDQSVDLYDARAPHVPGERVGSVAPVVLACTGTGCQGVPGAPPVFATPSSVTFNGVGNFTAATPSQAKPKKKPVKCAKGKKLTHGKCVKKPKKKAKVKAKAKKGTNKGRASR
jgi:hypothetical protein